MRALALSMSGGWRILRALAQHWRVAAPTAEAFAHCPPGSHDPARGPPLPAFRPIKIARAIYCLNLLRTSTFRRFVGYPLRALRDHNFKLPPPHRNSYYPLRPGGVAKLPRSPGQEWRLSYFASVGAIDEWRLGSFASVGAIGERQLGYFASAGAIDEWLS